MKDGINFWYHVRTSIMIILCAYVADLEPGYDLRYWALLAVVTWYRLAHLETLIKLKSKCLTPAP